MPHSLDQGLPVCELVESWVRVREAHCSFSPSSANSQPLKGSPAGACSEARALVIMSYCLQ